MKSGDILFVHYRFDPVGWLIRRAINCKYNHVAWILNKSTLIEAKGGGITLNPINKFSNKLFYKTKLMRIKDISTLDLNVSLYFALIRCQKTNRFKIFITFLLIFLGYKGKYPRPTCSGIIAESLSQVGFYFNKRKKPKNITPKDILKSRRLYEVCDINTCI